MDKETILFYDGECGLCNRTIQFLIRHERSPILKFCALQSNFARIFFHDKEFLPPNLDSVCLYTKGRIFRKSRAMFLIVKHLKWYYQIVRVFEIFPTSWTDCAYDIVAKRRKKMSFSCFLANEKFKNRFIA